MRSKPTRLGQALSDDPAPQLLEVDPELIERRWRNLLTFLPMMMALGGHWRVMTAQSTASPSAAMSSASWTAHERVRNRRAAGHEPAVLGVGAVSLS
jgi:hypothetical protein